MPETTDSTARELKGIYDHYFEGVSYSIIVRFSTSKDSYRNYPILGAFCENSRAFENFVKTVGYMPQRMQLNNWIESKI